jgi:acyl-CoA synthetase (AMP-forming)/AMP-acid ligase II
MLVSDFLERSARVSPQKTAIVADGESYSYGDVNRMADCVAGALMAGGLQSGERAAVFMENSVEAVVCVFGILKAGGAFLTVNPTTKAGKLSYVLNNCRAAALFGSARTPEVIKDACACAPHLRSVYVSSRGGLGVDAVKGLAKETHSLTEVLRGRGECRGRRAIDADLAAIIYTSGSTANPKGVVMTHLNMVSAANSIIEYLEMTDRDTILDMLPLSFDYGLYQVLMAFKVGATVILEKTFPYPYRVIEIMLRHGVTGLPIVPTISSILVKMEDIKRHDFLSLRYITNTAAALPVAHIKGLRGLFPRARIYSMYGLTECKRVAYLPPEELDARPGSVGKAMPNCEAFIVDELGQRVGPGVVGELVVRGSNVMRCYWEMPEETAEKIRPGAFPGDELLYTGDLFRMDGEGYLYFVGRKDDIIKSRGEKVSPREVEDVLYGMEGVAEAAVVGVDDPVLGQAIKAFITLRDGATLDEMEVQRHCSMHLEDFMVPKHVEFMKSLPKTETGKIRKQGLAGA